MPGLDKLSADKAFFFNVLDLARPLVADLLFLARDFFPALGMKGMLAEEKRNVKLL